MPKWVTPDGLCRVWKILKSVCLKVHSVHLFPQKDYDSETKCLLTNFVQTVEVAGVWR